MASLGRVAPTLSTLLEPTGLSCPRCAAPTLERLTVTILGEAGVLPAGRYLICAACEASAPDLPPEESRPSGGGA